MTPVADQIALQAAKEKMVNRCLGQGKSWQVKDERRELKDERVKECDIFWLSNELTNQNWPNAEQIALQAAKENMEAKRWEMKELTMKSEKQNVQRSYWPE